MDFETFRNAVDSLQDFPGMVGMIGGEPTIHPEFEKFAEYLRKSRIGDKRFVILREPVSDMLSYIMQYLNRTDNKLGLWSSLNEGYYKHFEMINDTFPTQYLNDHDNTCRHQALLMTRKELGISDEEWIKKRDACWVQNTWSAPKGLFSAKWQAHWICSLTVRAVGKWNPVGGSAKLKILQINCRGVSFVRVALMCRKEFQMTNVTI